MTTDPGIEGKIQETQKTGSWGKMEKERKWRQDRDPGEN